MLLGILSDTHDNLPQIARAVEHFNAAGADIVLHCGDLISPFCSRELQKLRARMVAVFGNNDGEHRMWYDNIASWGELHEGWYEQTLAGQRVLMMHEPRLIDELAASQKFDVILYGHTHRIDQRTVGKTLILNPGECGGWLTGKSTVATLRLPEKDSDIVTL